MDTKDRWRHIQESLNFYIERLDQRIQIYFTYNALLLVALGFFWENADTLFGIIAALGFMFGISLTMHISKAYIEITNIKNEYFDLSDSGYFHGFSTPSGISSLSFFDEQFLRVLWAGHNIFWMLIIAVHYWK